MYNIFCDSIHFHLFVVKFIRQTQIRHWGHDECSDTLIAKTIKCSFGRICIYINVYFVFFSFYANLFTLIICFNI